jgi:hypothetical protein
LSDRSEKLVSKALLSNSTCTAYTGDVLVLGGVVDHKEKPGVALDRAAAFTSAGWRTARLPLAGHVVGLYKLNPVDPSLERGSFQPLKLKSEKLVSSLCFQIQLVPLQRAAVEERAPPVLGGRAGRSAALFTTALFCGQNTVHLMTAGMVHVINLTPPGSECSPTCSCSSCSARLRRTRRL